MGVFAAPDKTKPVFDTKDISRITFSSAVNGIGEAEVPEEDMKEITAWLETFTVGKRAGKTLAPGTGSVSVQIEYADGRIVTSSLSTTEVNGILYLVECGAAPQCYLDLIS